MSRTVSTIRSTREEMGVLDFLQNPDVTIFQALLLKFKPVNMDVLPLYIVLLLWFPPMLWLLMRVPSFALAGSALIYALTWWFDWNIPAYPHGTWVFNPFAWQLLFVFGAWCALGGAQRLARWINSPVVIGLAVAYIAVCLRHRHDLVFPAPCHVRAELRQRSDLSDRQAQSRRAAHRAFPVAGGDHGVVRAARLAGACDRGFSGRRSFAGSIRWKPSASACSWRSPATSSSPKCPTACSRTSSSALSGIAIMVAAAALVSWYKRMERKGPGPRPPSIKPGYAGGDA